MADVSWVVPYVDGKAGAGVHGSGVQHPEEEVERGSYLHGEPAGRAADLLFDTVVHGSRNAESG